MISANVRHQQSPEMKQYNIVQSEENGIRITPNGFLIESNNPEWDERIQKFAKQI